MGFYRCFRKINPDVKQFSWWDYRAGGWQKNQGLRIDHIWVSRPLPPPLKTAGSTPSRANSKSQAIMRRSLLNLAEYPEQLRYIRNGCKTHPFRI